MAEIKATFWKEGEESYSFLTPINLQTEKKQSLVEIQNGILKLKDDINSHLSQLISQDGTIETEDPELVGSESSEEEEKQEKKKMENSKKRKRQN